MVLMMLAACLTACGGGGQTEQEAEPADEGPFTFENGVFTCQTFSVTVPDGWCIDEYADEDSVTFMNAASEEDYDVFSNASVDISVPEYSYQPPDSSLTKESNIENDKQFFEGEPAISDASLGIFSGSYLLGPSHAYNGCTNGYYILDSWVEGTDDCSIAIIRTSWYTDEEKAVIDQIVSSIVFTPGGTEEAAAPEEEAAAADDERFIDEENFSIQLPDDWYLDPDRSEGEIKLKCKRMSSGYVTVRSSPTGRNAEEWAEAYDGNFGGGNTIETYEYNGATYKGINPDSLSILVADASAEGVTVHVKTMFCMLDSIEDLMNAITIK